MVFMLSVHYYCQILMKLEFSLRFFKKNLHASIFLQIPPVEFDLFHADGRKYMTKLTVAFPNFANPPKNWKRERKVTQSRQLFERLIGVFNMSLVNIMQHNTSDMTGCSPLITLLLAYRLHLFHLNLCSHTHRMELGVAICLGHTNFS